MWAGHLTVPYSNAGSFIYLLFSCVEKPGRDTASSPEPACQDGVVVMVLDLDLKDLPHWGPDPRVEEQWNTRLQVL